jgi:hypothetical protein
MQYQTEILVKGGKLDEWYNAWLLQNRFSRGNSCDLMSFAPFITCFTFNQAPIFSSFFRSSNERHVSDEPSRRYTCCAIVMPHSTI